MNAKEGYCERRITKQPLEGSVLSIAERQKLQKKPCPGTRWMYKRTHAHMCTQTHTHINTNKKLATEHKEKECICTSQMIVEQALLSQRICFLLTDKTPAFLQTCHPENAAERCKNAGVVWDAACKNRLPWVEGQVVCHWEDEFPEVYKHTWICPLI